MRLVGRTADRLIAVQSLVVAPDFAPVARQELADSFAARLRWQAVGLVGPFQTTPVAPRGHIALRQGVVGMLVVALGFERLAPPMLVGNFALELRCITPAPVRPTQTAALQLGLQIDPELVVQPIPVAAFARQAKCLAKQLELLNRFLSTFAPTSRRYTPRHPVANLD